MSYWVGTGTCSHSKPFDGSLQLQARTQQASLFNTPKSGFNVLAASDAIGMGLNLNIR